MSSRLSLQDLRRAYDAKDPALVDLLLRLAQQPDDQPDTPIREGALTFDGFLRELGSWQYRRKAREEQAHYRVETLKALEAPDAEVPLPDRLRTHQILYVLWQDNSLFARRCLLDAIARVPLTYGPWRALKRIFKEAEARVDVEIYGALAARFDNAVSRGGYHGGVRGGTIAYLVRRAWRFLRRIGVSLPACYPDYCVEFLAHYTDDTNWRRTWIANHVFYHNTKKYNRSSFTFHQTPSNILTNRAYADLWTRTPRPLFALLERARSETAREFAVTALKTDFRAALRDVEPPWVARLVGLASRTVDDFVVWILNNVPRFEQGNFRSLGLHDAGLRLFDSPSDAARAYAAEYARTHARDLPVDELIRLANNSHTAVRKLAADLLQSRDPRKDVGLDAWGQLLETDHGHELAASILRKHFGATELTPAWFTARLLSPSLHAFRFAEKQLPQIHPFEKLGAGFFVDLLETIGGPAGEDIRNNWGWGDSGWGARIANFAFKALPQFDVNTLDRDFLKRIILDPQLRNWPLQWINEGKLRTKTLGTDYFKLLAYHPAWDEDPWLTALRASNRPWAKQLTFDQPLSGQSLAWLGDVRKFPPSELGFDWLMKLVTRSETEYHDFAVEVMIKAFRPADFAPKAAGAIEVPAAAETKVDLAGATFLFTGKLATMKREEAEKKLEQAGGKAFSSVSNKLQYLVIGDEGSPLYGQGKKGSKQVKAEEVNAAGGNIRIISETAFLEMLAGRKAEPVSDDATLAGSQRLWDMAIAPGQADAPLGAFARKYIRRHHAGIGQEQTDRPLDPGMEIPESFFTFERAEPLFGESRKPVRELALDLARFEFARWAPAATALVRLAEQPYADVREFVSKALLSEDAPEHKRYRINPDLLSPAAVYSFCESPDEGTRMLGMELIQRSPRLRLPEELFRLTESPDRKVRAFVIRALWSLYRDRGTTPDWKPYVPPQSSVGAAKKKPEEDRGPGTPHRPEQPPAPPQGMREFFRRILFEVPPGRSESGSAGEAVEGISVRLRPLPARRAKLSLIEVMRDLALEDAEFGKVILPLLDEFMVSRGKSEHDACLVAATRIRHRGALAGV